MYLLVDNSAEEKVVFAYTDGAKWKKVEFSRPENDKVSLLSLLDKLLKKINLKLSDICGIAVAVGKGKFTATRIAVTLANALAYSLKIPVMAAGDENGAALLKKLKTAKPGIYVSAKYSAEATIGKRKC